MQSLERKYLLGEMISNYGSFQLELFIQILRSSLKSMTQEVSKVQIEKKEYQELIEKWAHELKAPIASITLVCENNPSELSRKILLQANRLSYNVEQVLYYARLGYKLIIHFNISSNRLPAKEIIVILFVSIRILEYTSPPYFSFQSKKPAFWSNFFLFRYRSFYNVSIL